MTSDSLDTVLRGGLAVLQTGVRRADIGIRDGKIAAIGYVSSPSAEEIDATGLFVLPGLVDAHTHLDYQRLPNGPLTADDYYSGTVAAAFGGVTTVIDYARQRPGMGVLASIENRMAAAAKQAVVDYSFHAIPVEHTEASLNELGDIVEAGFPSAKVFMHRATDDWISQVLRTFRHLGGLTMLHPESLAINQDATAALRALGRANARHWAEARPVASEVEGVRRAIRLTSQTGAAAYLVHLSSAEAIAEVRRARRAGIRIFSETRPAYLALTGARYGDPPPAHLQFTGYPPLRDEASINALWQAVRERTIDTIASDHSGWTLEQKAVGDNDLERLPQGFPSLEAQLPVLYTAGVVAGRVSLPALVRAMATRPAQLLGLYPRKGAIRVGGDADLVELDPRSRRRITVGDMHSRAGYEPMEGFEAHGWPVRTWRRGVLVTSDGELLAEPGSGELVRRLAFSVPGPSAERPTRSV